MNKNELRISALLNLLFSCSIILLFISSISLNLFASDKIDSLKTELRKDLPDTIRLKVLTTLSWQLKFQNPDTAIILAKQSLSILNILENDNKRAFANRKKPASLSLAISKRQANNYNNIGVYYSIKGDYTLSLSNYFRALELREVQENDKTLPAYRQALAISLGNIGLAYTNQGDYPKALEYYFKALKMDEELENENGIARHLGNIGLVYADQGDYSKALEYHLKALKIKEESGSKRGIAASLGNIGIICFSQGDYSKALEYLFKALKMDEEIEDKIGIATVLGNIGSVYYAQGNLARQQGNNVTGGEDYSKANGVDHENLYNKALEYFFKALKMRKELGAKNLIASTLGNLGSIYTQTGRFVEAEVYLDSALQLSESIGTLNLTMQFEKSLSSVYDTTARYKKALIHYKKYTITKDSLFNEAKSKDIGRLEQKHEFEMAQLKSQQEEEAGKRQEAAQLSRRNSLQYSLIVLGLLVLGLLIAMLGRFNLTTRVVEGIVFISFLIFFEFLLVLLDPYMESWTGGEPLWKLLANAVLASAIFPLHSFFEEKVKKRILKLRQETKPPMGSGGNGKTLVLFLGLVVVLGLNTGFDTKKDSLIQNLKLRIQNLPVGQVGSKDLPDTTRIKLLNTLAWQFKYQSPDTAIFFGKQALSILLTVIASEERAKQSPATILTLQKLTAFTQSDLGTYYRLKGDYPLSLSHHFKALEIGETQNI
ncbi:tetratricopeptide repeat protein, partial [bacterium AH-315-C07]|nr:tetratricopeptide repeat protein [bacterium AH-315-C07]